MSTSHRTSRHLLPGVLIALLFAVAGTACGSDGSVAAGADAGSPATTVAPTTTAAPTTTSTAPPTTTTAPPPPTTTTPPGQVAGSPLPPGSKTLYVLGDSVILGAETTVPPALAGWQVTFDAKESRRIDQGTAIVAGRGGAMGRVLVVHLCTNWGGGDYRAAAHKLLAQLHGVERVVWVTCTPWLPAVGAADDAIRSLPASDLRVVVADWALYSGAPGFTYNDGLHLKPGGAAALAKLVSAVVGPAPG